MAKIKTDNSNKAELIPNPLVVLLGHVVVDVSSSTGGPLPAGPSEIVGLSSHAV